MTLERKTATNKKSSKDIFHIYTGYWIILVSIWCYNHFQKCWDTSRFSLKYCNTSIPLVPYSMLSRNCHIFVLAIDIQTSNSTLNGGGGRGRSNSWQVNCAKAECNVKPYVSQVFLKMIVVLLSNKGEFLGKLWHFKFLTPVYILWFLCQSTYTRFLVRWKSTTLDRELTCTLFTWGLGSSHMEKPSS